METFKDLFSHIPDILKFGLLGLAVIMLFVLAYIATNQPDKKFPIVIITFFCAFVLVFFTLSGIGLQNEVHEVKTVNSHLEASKDSLLKKNDTLNTTIKIVDAKLNSTRLINELNNNALQVSSIGGKVDSLTGYLATIKANYGIADKVQFDNVTTKYIDLGNKAKNPVPFTSNDKLVLFNNNNAAKELIYSNQ